MTGASFNRPYKPFGLNIKVPERTIKQAGATLGNVAGSAVDPLFKYLEENEKVFNGDLNSEIRKTVAQSFNTGMLMQAEDKKINGEPPSFDMHF